eukprot:GHVQ01001554.1.p1 GENE.GHVQ01001554.1~~GHVQ01001554.1.p1  ORF type:complete len:1098 (-),score=234.97 GHVQ01001554.1:279-3572(-)
MDLLSVCDFPTVESFEFVQHSIYLNHSGWSSELRPIVSHSPLPHYLNSARLFVLYLLDAFPLMLNAASSSNTKEKQTKQRRGCVCDGQMISWEVGGGCLVKGFLYFTGLSLTRDDHHLHKRLLSTGGDESLAPIDGSLQSIRESSSTATTYKQSPTAVGDSSLHRTIRDPSAPSLGSTEADELSSESGEIVKQLSRWKKTMRGVGECDNEQQAQHQQTEKQEGDDGGHSKDEADEKERDEKSVTYGIITEQTQCHMRICGNEAITAVNNCTEIGSTTDYKLRSNEENVYDKQTWDNRGDTIDGFFERSIVTVVDHMLGRGERTSSSSSSSCCSSSSLYDENGVPAMMHDNDQSADRRIVMVSVCCQCGFGEDVTAFLSHLRNHTTDLGLQVSSPGTADRMTKRRPCRNLMDICVTEIGIGELITSFDEFPVCHPIIHLRQKLQAFLDLNAPRLCLIKYPNHWFHREQPNALPVDYEPSAPFSYFEADESSLSKKTHANSDESLCHRLGGKDDDQTVDETRHSAKSDGKKKRSSKSGIDEMMVDCLKWVKRRMVTLQDLYKHDSESSSNLGNLGVIVVFEGRMPPLFDTIFDVTLTKPAGMTTTDRTLAIATALHNSTLTAPHVTAKPQTPSSEFDCTRCYCTAASEYLAGAAISADSLFLPYLSRYLLLHSFRSQVVTAAAVEPSVDDSSASSPLLTCLSDPQSPPVSTWLTSQYPLSGVHHLPTRCCTSVICRHLQHGGYSSLIVNAGKAVRAVYQGCATMASIGHSICSTSNRELGCSVDILKDVVGLDKAKEALISAVKQSFEYISQTMPSASRPMISSSSNPYHNTTSQSQTNHRLSVTSTTQCNVAVSSPLSSSSPFCILFHGPSGSGKSLLGASIPSIGYLFGPEPLSVMSVDIVDVIHCGLGDTQASIHRIFRLAHDSCRPVVIFVDDIDELVGSTPICLSTNGLGRPDSEGAGDDWSQRPTATAHGDSRHKHDGGRREKGGERDESGDDSNKQSSVNITRRNLLVDDDMAGADKDSPSNRGGQEGSLVWDLLDTLCSCIDRFCSQRVMFVCTASCQYHQLQRMLTRRLGCVVELRGDEIHKQTVVQGRL